MARQNKVGLDYFELDCHMDDKVRLIQAEFGLKGFAVFVKLLQKIYEEHGYYCEWTQDQELLFLSENGCDSGSLQLLREIVSACIRRNIFSERLFEEYGILTSSGVQKQYLKATARREVVKLKKEYLLINVPKNAANVAIEPISVDINSINDSRNTQSKEEKSRVDNNKFSKENLCPAERGQDTSEEPKKKQSKSADSMTPERTELVSRIVTYLNVKCNTRYKPTTDKTKKCINARLNEGFTEEDFYTVIDTKAREWLSTDWEKYLRPETLFGTKFESYLNQGGGKAAKPKPKPKPPEKDETIVEYDEYWESL